MSATAHETARVHRLTVEAYRRMGETGILPPDLRTELIEGEIIEMPPIGPSHGGSVKLLSNFLKESVRSTAVLSVQDPIKLDPYSEPQPDIALLRPRADYYRKAHPLPEDTLLVIEVADTTLPYDHEVKLPLYAKAGIPEAWLVDLTAQTLTIYRNPSANGYCDSVKVENWTRVDVPVTPPQTVDLSTLFGDV